MSILDVIMSAQNGAAVQQLGSQVGLGDEQTAAALSALVPALAAGFQQNAQSEGGLTSLLSALAGGTHSQYVDNPSSLATDDAVSDGNGILGHVFGSKDVSRQVAAQAASQTGISAEIMKKLLPLAAAMMMGAFARHSSGTSGTGTSGLAPAGGGLTDLLGSLLGGAGGAGGIDVAGMLGGLLRRS